MKKGLVIGTPKGSLERPLEELIRQAGLEGVFEKSGEDQMILMGQELEVIKLRALDIPLYVARGDLDIGISGQDCVKERGLEGDVVEILFLPLTKAGNEFVKIVLFVKQESPVKTIADFTSIVKIIATEYPSIAKEYLREKDIVVQIDVSHGATEAIVRGGLADAGIDVVDSGISLKINELRIIDTVMRSRTVLIANREALNVKGKLASIEILKMLLESAVISRDMVFLEMNVSLMNLKKAMSILPALKKPTVSPLNGQEKWFAVKSVVPRWQVNHLILMLKKIGAQGIVEYPVNKVVI